MKTLIKKHYKDPKVNSFLLQNVLKSHTEKKFYYSLTGIISICILMMLMILFMKHFISFNISYLDINGSLISSISLPILFILNLAIALIHFIYHNMLILGMLGVLYFILSFDSLVRKY